MRVTPVEGRRPEVKPDADLSGRGIPGKPGGTPAPSSGDGPPVLIVDDDEGILRAHSKLLERAGFTVSSVDNGIAAFEALQTTQFGVILCDIQMPGLSGMSFFEQLEEQSPQMASRVVFVSGFVDQHDTHEFLVRTGQPFLSKPSTREELVDVVRQMIERCGRESGLFVSPPNSVPKNSS